MPDWLTRNLPYRALALALALLIAVSVYDQPEQEFMVEIGAALTELPAGRIFVGELPARISLRLRGPESELLEIVRRSADLRYEVSLADRVDGDVVRFDEHSLEDLLGVHDVRVVSVMPSRLNVMLARRATRRVPVRPAYTGAPPEGFVLISAQVKVEPDTVKVAGPEEEVMQITELETVPVDLRGLDRPARFEQRIASPAADHVTIDVDSVSVHVAIASELRRIDYPRVPVQLNGCAPNVRCTVQPQRVRVTLHGPYAAIKGLPPEPPPGLVSARAAVAGKSGSVTLEIRRDLLPEGVAAQVEPVAVRVTSELLPPPRRAPPTPAPPAPEPKREEKP